MICEACEERGGFEGDGPFEATHFVVIVSPPEPSESNPLRHLCIPHAQRAAEACVGFGWGVHVSLIEPMEEASLEEWKEE